ncbi:putative toxin-antitoxin system toxin component, PIN family [Candidatus Woesearchaeota archaeon]|nr:putative toxin-antitoxin system toxin component, PIN family [Candidatus Woesearchaeota archaeon]
MRITVDTNVLVSSTFWAGDSDRIIRMVEDKEIELVLSEEIIKEFIRVLNYDDIKKKVKNLDMRRPVEKIVSIAKIISPREKIKAVKDDPDDDKFLECAQEGKAEYLVSKDNHLLKIRNYKGIKILLPQDFLKIIGD